MADRGDRNLSELLQLARDYSTRNIDLYQILDISTTTLDKDIHRAWKRQNLRYHPDKTGASFDPVKYELVGHARDILVEPAAKKTYDDLRSAALQRRAERDRLDNDRRRKIDELEAAELEGERIRAAAAAKSVELEQEKLRLRQEGIRRQEELDRADREKRDEAQRELANLEDREEEILSRLRENKEAKARRKADRKARKSGVGISEGATGVHDGVSGEEGRIRKPRPKNRYYYSTDPLLTYDEKVAGVMARLRAAQKKRDEARAELGTA